MSASDSTRATLVETTSTADAPAEKCPKCGSEEVYTQFFSPEQTSAGCDTYVKRCLDCDWEGDPE
jgi:uncharacterized protein (DUF983 family)